MKEDVENIAKNKKNICRPIYEVIDTFFEETNISKKLFQTYEKNSNQSQFLPSKVKVVLKRMVMEKGLYAQVVMIR